MSDPIQATGSCLQALSDQFRAVTNNLANADTVGYKSRRTAFAQALARAGVDPAATEVVGSLSLDLTQGPLLQTGRPLDVALDGEGFFVLETPDGPLYTRNGAFRTNASNQLVDAAGNLVAGESGPIVIPPSASQEQVHVGRDGTIYADGQAIGKLRMVRFEDPSVLTPRSSGAFVADDGASPQTASPAVQQGFREGSNVSVVEEMVKLITISRMYEANMKTLSATQDERLRSLLDVAMA